MFGWTLLMAAAFNFVFVHDLAKVRSGWLAVAAQVGFYLLLVLPAVVYAPRTLGQLRMPRAQAAAGISLIAAALAYASVLHHIQPLVLFMIAVRLAATGFGEELVFRGFIWEELRTAGLGFGPLLALTVALFTAFHAPALLAGAAGFVNVITIAVFGLVAGVVRWRCGNAGLPALLHTAVDIAGI